MKLETKVEIAAGVLILVSIGLAQWVDDLWIILAVFIGLNLIQSPISGYCAIEKVFVLMHSGGRKSDKKSNEMGNP